MFKHPLRLLIAGLLDVFELACLLIFLIAIACFAI